jgi:hypothetical protein
LRVRPGGEHPPVGLRRSQRTSRPCSERCGVALSVVRKPGWRVVAPGASVGLCGLYRRKRDAVSYPGATVGGGAGDVIRSCSSSGSGFHLVPQPMLPPTHSGCLASSLRARLTGHLVIDEGDQCRVVVLLLIIIIIMVGVLGACDPRRGRCPHLRGLGRGTASMPTPRPSARDSTIWRTAWLHCAARSGSNPTPVKVRPFRAGYRSLGRHAGVGPLQDLHESHADRGSSCNTRHRFNY